MFSILRMLDVLRMDKMAVAFVIYKPACNTCIFFFPFFFFFQLNRFFECINIRRYINLSTKGNVWNNNENMKFMRKSCMCTQYII